MTAPTPPTAIPAGWANMSWLAKRYDAAPAAVAYWIKAGAFAGTPIRKHGGKKRTTWLKSSLPSRREIDQRVRAFEAGESRRQHVPRRPLSVPTFLEL